MNFEAFRTLSEVATGLTGFVGVILAIRCRTEPLPRLQLVGFLQNSLAVLIFSLLPEFLINTFGHAILVMRVLCCVVALYHLGIMINYVRKQKDLLAMTLVQKAITLLSLPVIILTLSVASGFFLGYAVNVFYFALLWHLGVGIYIFSQILLLEASNNAA
jgi:hypothetical protein